MDLVSESCVRKIFYNLALKRLFTYENFYLQIDCIADDCIS